MIIKCDVLFQTSENTTDVEDVINIETGDYIIEKDSDGNDVKYIPSIAKFDMYDVAAINKSPYQGYSQVRFYNGHSWSVRIPFNKLERLYDICKG